MTTILATRSDFPLLTFNYNRRALIARAGDTGELKAPGECVFRLISRLRLKRSFLRPISAPRGTKGKLSLKLWANYLAQSRRQERAEYNRRVIGISRERLEHEAREFNGYRFQRLDSKR